MDENKILSWHSDIIENPLLFGLESNGLCSCHEFFDVSEKKKNMIESYKQQSQLIN